MVYEIMKHAGGLFRESPPDVFLVFYATYQPLYEKMAEEVQKTFFYRGLPTDELIEKHRHLSKTNHLFLIIDDQADAAMNDDFISHLFVAGTHHRNVSTNILPYYSKYLLSSL